MNASYKTGLASLGLATLSFVAINAPAHAAYLTFFGEDLGNGSTRLPSFPNADAARNTFFSNLVGVGTETFESFAGGTVPPLPINFGSDTATLTGAGSVNNLPSGTFAGRYPISGNKYYEVSPGFGLTFSAPQAAFGFYGIDIGDFNGQITLNLTLAGGGSQLLTVPNSKNVPSGGVLYFGVIATDPSETFTGITFGNTASGVDFFGFDNFSIGRLEQVKPVPVPGALAGILLASGALGFTEARRRRQQAKKAAG
jgi:hypothetical protein